MSRIDPAGNQVVATIKVGDYPTGIAADAAAVWVTNFGSSGSGSGNGTGTVTRIDPANNRVVATIKVHDNPSAIAADGHAVWWPTSAATRCPASTRPVTG